MHITATLLILACFFSNFFSLLPQPAPNPTALTETRSGMFTTVWGDPLPTETDASAIQKYFLTDENGKTVELIIAPDILQRAGGVNALNGQRVIITGNMSLKGETAAEESFLAAEITLGKDQALPNLQPTSTAPTASRPFVNILCRFADSTATTPQQPSFFTGFFSSSRPGLDHYYRDISFGNIDLVGTQVVGWYNLPQPRSYYYTSDPPNFQRMAADCTAAADSVIDFTQFQGINLAFNQNIGCCAWGGAQSLTLDGQTRAFPMTWMPPGGFIQSIFAHEMGHSFGWAHSANALGTTYGSGWDVMSKDRYNAAATADPTYGSVGQDTISYNLDKAGWIPAARKYTAGIGTTATINLERLNQPGATGYLMAQIPINGTTSFYTVEARYRVSYDLKLSNDAVVIHSVIPSRLDDAWTVDPDGNAEPMDAGGQWLPGETFTDAANGISVKVNSATASGFNVTITKLAPTAANVNISGQITDFDGRAVRGAIVSMVDGSGSVRYAQSNTFGYYRFIGVPAGVVYTLNVNHKRYSFNSQIVSVNDELVDLNFSAQP
jgi:M6 family metalloprotease-like protein